MSRGRTEPQAERLTNVIFLTLPPMTSPARADRQPSQRYLGPPGCQQGVFKRSHWHKLPTRQRSTAACKRAPRPASSTLTAAAWWSPRSSAWLARGRWQRCRRWSRRPHAAVRYGGDLRAHLLGPTLASLPGGLSTGRPAPPRRPHSMLHQRVSVARQLQRGAANEAVDPSLAAA